MAWRFTRQDMLVSPDGRSWRAVSGPHGYGRIPRGQYQIGEVKEVNPSENNGGYTDADGFAWWCPVYSRAQGPHIQMGIHPDGNVPGTHGCVGIKESTSKNAFDTLKSSMDKVLVVE